MIRTIPIQDSTEQVVAPTPKTGQMLPGTRIKIQVKQGFQDPDLPEAVVKVMPGMLIWTIFSKAQLKEHVDVSHIPDNSLCAYREDVVEALAESCQPEAAKALRTVPEAEELDLIVFPPETFDLCK